MGEYAEMALEQELYDLGFEPRLNKFKEFRKSNKTLWMKRDGSIIHIAKMEDRHLKNSIAMLQRGNQTEYLVYKGLTEEAKKRRLI